MKYFYTGAICLFLFWLGLFFVARYGEQGALILALIGSIPGAIVFVWWQAPHQFKPAKLRPMFTDEKGEATRQGSSYENIPMARDRQARQKRRREGLASRLLRQRPR